MELAAKEHWHVDSIHAGEKNPEESCKPSLFIAPCNDCIEFDRIVQQCCVVCARIVQVYCSFVNWIHTSSIDNCNYTVSIQFHSNYTTFYKFITYLYSIFFVVYRVHDPAISRQAQGDLAR